MQSAKINIENHADAETRRFRLPIQVSDHEQEFIDVNSARKSRLATKIFGFPWTEKVVVGTDYVDVTKQDWVDWETLAEPLAGLIAEHMTMVQDEKLDDATTPPMGTNKRPAKPPSTYVAGDPVSVKIQEILDTQVNPAVASHGGKITFEGYKDGKAFVRLEGGCHGCSSSKVTLQQGVERMIKNAVPEVNELIDVTDHAAGENPYYA